MKAFTKGETAIYICQYDDTTFAFRRVIVESCGAKRMTLKHSATGEMLGSDFPAMVGFGNLNYSAEWMAANFVERPVHHCFRHGVFKDMTDDQAMAACVAYAQTYVAWEVKEAEARLANYKAEHGETGYYTQCMARLNVMKAATPGAIQL